MNRTELVMRLRNRANWDTMTNEAEPEDHIDWIAADEIDGLAASLELCRTESEARREDVIKHREVLRNLVRKLDECHDHINDAFVIAYHARGRDYDGPSYESELLAAREILLAGVREP